jgi:hypothetical protein
MTTEIVGSKMQAGPPKPRGQKDTSGYGYNDDSTQSSLTPSQIAAGQGKSNFLPQCELPAENANGQTRTISAQGLAPAGNTGMAKGNKLPEAGATLGSVARSPTRGSGGAKLR